MIPRVGAEYRSVLKKVVGITFCTCGDPGSASIVKVNEPSAMVPGIKRFGILDCLNKFLANG